MTGLKSGSGDDLWGDDGGDETDDSRDAGGTDADTEVRSDADSGADVGDDRASGPATDDNRDDAGSAPEPASSTTETDDSGPAPDGSSTDSGGTSDSQSYIVRRAVRDKSVQFERDERLTFFVHDDVAEGERDLVTDLQSALGRDVPKFDVREAVYRAALRNPDDVLDELLEMGYSLEDD